jgi:hypothetical protein
MVNFDRIEHPSPITVNTQDIWASVAVENQPKRFEEIALVAQQPQLMNARQMANVLARANDFGPGSQAATMLATQLRLQYEAGFANGGVSAGGSAALEAYVAAIRTHGIDLRMDYNAADAGRLISTCREFNLPVPTYIRTLQLYRNGARVGQPAGIGIDPR